ncbi:phosphate ABC transporter permease PstA [Alkalimarinus sediminis]|uniref:Phosphate transport system permease protein PstA n=1 Tax=Alkalimarinus sediminis TaxID=1632866 RepID=A0A9E8HGV8_9ALTE|nr:phosphate ABC transporter permease PstA [Alkalimarinus sediminis]UZW74005.1 phosphate ABC transporter permease PstA [Alkalimarinus sediminis]
MRVSLKNWSQKGSPWIWLNAGAVAISLIMVVGLLGLIAAKGLVHFWPHAVMEAEHIAADGTRSVVIGEIVETEDVAAEQLRTAGVTVPDGVDFLSRDLLKIGNRDVSGFDFRWVLDRDLSNKRYPEKLMVMERYEWGNFYGYLHSVKERGQEVSLSKGQDLWLELQSRIERAEGIREKIDHIEKGEIGSINRGLERLRLKQRALELKGKATPKKLADIQAERTEYDIRYEGLQTELTELYGLINRDSLVATTMDESVVEIPLAKVVKAYRPNQMNLFEKVIFYVKQIGAFITEDPREANTEGGIFPAIFGTVMMVILMSILVTPLGVITAVYLREYARQGPLTRVIRIAVNNLAGVPSIVYGVFGLGFFIYFIGSGVDQAMFPEALPSPTFGTPGLLWASITLALLTLPVVIVATEEGLSRIPRSIREGSLALGATKAETLWRVVIPMASPAMMTGVILAIARAAGEVAPLMLVGVVKLAPSLPLDGNFPYLHLDQKFMHLGFHIYDVGFQSPNVEAARPLVYATSLLLVVVIALLNLSAVSIRNRLREKYKALEM